jgi:small redox-active disulfide protein 1
MKSVKFEFFYSPLCPTCPKAKEIVRKVAEEEGIELEEINILSPVGEACAKKYGLKSVPYLVINEVHQICGIPTKETILEFIKKGIKVDKQINLKGEVCPYTYVKSKLAIEEMEAGEILEIILDHKPAVENVPTSMENEGHKVLEVSQINDTDFKIIIKKLPKG